MEQACVTRGDTAGSKPEEVGHVTNQLVLTVVAREVLESCFWPQCLHCHHSCGKVFTHVTNELVKMVTTCYMLPPTANQSSS